MCNGLSYSFELPGPPHEVNFCAKSVNFNCEGHVFRSSLKNSCSPFRTKRRLAGVTLFVALVAGRVTVGVLGARPNTLRQPVSGRKFPGRSFPVCVTNDLRLDGSVGALQLPALLADVLGFGKVSWLLIQVSQNLKCLNKE